MKVLVADKFEAEGLTSLQNLGLEVVVEPSLVGDSLRERLSSENPDVLVVRSTKVSADALAAASRLKLVVRAGAGYDTIDVAAASEGGVFVSNCPGKNSVAVAELTWALILSCDRRIPDQVRDIREGIWRKAQYGAADGLYGKTLGVAGLGSIGLEVVKRAIAFGMPVAVWSRSLSEDRATSLGVTRVGSPVDLARLADVVSIHVASTPDTVALVNDEFVDAMKPGAFLINTSRGAVVDEAALIRGIESKGLRVGLDVYDGEPKSGSADFDSAIAKLPGVYGTHHVGASTAQAQRAIAREAVRVIRMFVASGRPANCVNVADRSTAAHQLIVRHRNRPGVLATVLDAISRANINVEEMDNLLYRGATAACATIHIDDPLPRVALAAITNDCPDILSIEQSPISK